MLGCEFHHDDGVGVWYLHVCKIMGVAPVYRALVLLDGSLECDTSIVGHFVRGIECSGPQSTFCDTTSYGVDSMVLVDGTASQDILFV